MLVFAGTKRYGTRAKGVSQRSLGVAWFLVTILEGTEKKGNRGHGVICSPAVSKVKVDFSNGVDLRQAVSMRWVFMQVVVNGRLN